MKRIRARGLDVERELRSLRPQPREELVRALIARMHERARSRSRRYANRVALGSGVTALFVAALVPAGGLGYASGAASRAASAVKRTVTVSIHDEHPDAHKTDAHHDPQHKPSHDDHATAHHPTSGQHEYGIPICHHSDHGFVLIRVSREALPAHLNHHDDIIPAPEHGCP